MTQPAVASAMSASAIEPQVWNKWLAKNREEEKAYSAKWRSRAGTLLFVLAIAAIVYLFVR